MKRSDVKLAYEAAPVVTHNIGTADTGPAFVVQYVPSKGTGGSAATIALVQDGDMTFLVDSAAPSGADAIGTAGVIDTSAAAYDTVGELVNAINATQAWRAYAICRPETDMATILAKSAASAIGANGLTFYLDLSASESIEVAISGEKFVNNGKNGHIKEWNHKVRNYLLSLAIQQDMASNGTLALYEAKQGETSCTLLYSATLTDNTELTKGADYPLVPWDEAKPGYRYIVRAYHATDIGASAIAKFIVRGKSAFTNGEYVVSEVNY